jgi:hypothetical protein
MEPLEADRIWSPSIRLGSLIFHNQESFGHGRKLSQEKVLVLNKVQGVRHENSIHRGKAEAGAPKIRQKLVDRDSAVLILDPVQRSLVEIDRMNGTAGCEQLRKRDRERSAATAEIAPGLGSLSFD